MELAGLLFVQLVFHHEQIARFAPEEQRCFFFVASAKIDFRYVYFRNVLFLTVLYFWVRQNGKVPFKVDLENSH